MSDFQLIQAFASKHNKTWPNIAQSVELTNNNCQKIINAFQKEVGSLTSADADMIVFGSIARNECTAISDVDWTLLVDGQVKDDYEYAKIIKKILKNLEMPDPGTSGMFGQITYSHDLVHYIGGEDDTNHNISRRILLLLESDKLLINGENDVYGTAFERVQKAIIRQYVLHDSGLSSVNKDNAKVPRFLLNDIIRFWRTMCVDFAYKQKEQDGFKWGLRNIKLRLSRKLIYIKGILICFSCYINPSLNKENIAQFLVDLTRKKPLDIILEVLGERGLDDLLITIFDKYDEFIGILNDEKIRTTLKELRMEDAYNDATFLAARVIANDFQIALTELFERDRDLKEFTKHYLIF